MTTPPSGIPRRSDVPLTSRWQHFTPASGLGPGSGRYTTWGAAAAFGATRLDWLYSTNATFVAAARSHGLRSVALAMNGELPDPGSSPPTYAIGRAESVLGEPLVAPWMSAWPNPPSPGCVNKPDYIAIVQARLEQLVDAGADSIQHDDPAINAGLASWYGGDPHRSGCYCSHCMSGFTSALMQLNVSERAFLNVTSDFDYRAFLLANESGTAPDVLHALRVRFVRFQAASMANYSQRLRATVPAHVALSCNGGGDWDVEERYLDAFDYGVGELHAASSNPGGLRWLYIDGVPPGKAQLMTMPKQSNTTAVDVNSVRRAVATAYALGGTMLVPWDIYLPTSNASRYYGTPELYGDLYNLVRVQGNLMELTDARVAYDPALASAVLNHSGVTGDGVRWRLPTDDPPARGRVVGGGVNVGACAWLARDCAGFFHTASSCFALDQLITISHTAVDGHSYARSFTPVARPFLANVSTVDVLARAAAAAPRKAAWHLIDWSDSDAHAAIGSKSGDMVTLSLDYGTLFGLVPCSAEAPALLLLDPSHPDQPLPLHSRCQYCRPQSQHQ